MPYLSITKQSTCILQLYLLQDAFKRIHTSAFPVSMSQALTVLSYDDVTTLEMMVMKATINVLIFKKYFKYKLQHLTLTMI